MKLKVALLYIHESVLKAKVSNVHVTCPADAYFKKTSAQNMRASPKDNESNFLIHSIARVLCISVWFKPPQTTPLLLTLTRRGGGFNQTTMYI